MTILKESLAKHQNLEMKEQTFVPEIFMTVSAFLVKINKSSFWNIWKTFHKMTPNS